MRALRDRSLVRDEHVEAVAMLEAFGRRIGNTDMHLGNVSLAVDGDGFRPVPVHDMCSMVLAPVGGEARSVQPPGPDAPGAGPPDAGAASLDVARELARAFWSRVRRDDRASGELVALAARAS